MISKKKPPKNPKNINTKNKNRNENTNQINPPPEKMKQNKLKKTYKLKKILLELVFSVILS